jgi:soluble lytic murein transglycosylase-like protein
MLASAFVLSSAMPCLAVERNVTARDSYASVMRTINPRLPESKSLAYASALLTSARRMHVDPTLMMAVVTVESHWDAGAVSDRGAEGLGQLEPDTAHDLGVNPRSPSANLRGTAMYLHRLLALFSEAREPLREAIAGYNAGPYAVKSYGGVPPYGETRSYVGKVLLAWRSVRARLGNVADLDDQPADPVRDFERAEAAYWGLR